MIADRIKELREKHHLSQTELAKRLSITRSAVNAWEMGISVPSTQYIVELAKFFHVSTDYLLDISNQMTIDISHFNDEEQEIIFKIIQYFNAQHN